MPQKRVSFRYLSFSIQTSLKQVFADREISIELVLFWVKCAVNTIKAKSVSNRFDNNSKTGSYIATFTDIPVFINATGQSNIIKNRKYIILPHNILDLDLDRAVDWMAYYLPQSTTNVNCPPTYFERTTIKEAQEMYNSYLEKPVYTRPYFARANEKLYLWGVETIPIKTVDIALYIAEDPYIAQMNLDDEILLDDQQILTVQNTVMSLGFWVEKVPQERRQDGADTRNIPAPEYKQPIPTSDQQ